MRLRALFCAEKADRPDRKADPADGRIAICGVFALLRSLRCPCIGHSERAKKPAPPVILRRFSSCHPERAKRAEGSLFHVIPTSSHQGAMADGALCLPPRPQRLPLLFPKSSSILFGSPVSVCHLPPRGKARMGERVAQSGHRRHMTHRGRRREAGLCSLPKKKKRESKRRMRAENG